MTHKPSVTRRSPDRARSACRQPWMKMRGWGAAGCYLNDPIQKAYMRIDTAPQRVELIGIPLRPFPGDRIAVGVESASIAQPQNPALAVVGMAAIEQLAEHRRAAEALRSGYAQSNRHQATDHGLVRTRAEQAFGNRLIERDNSE